MPSSGSVSMEMTLEDKFYNQLASTQSNTVNTHLKRVLQPNFKTLERVVSC